MVRELNVLCAIGAVNSMKGELVYCEVLSVCTIILAGCS